MKKINEAERLEQMTQYERPFWERGIAVAGMDEVGRGPLAGPVVAACVILPPGFVTEGVNDSKKLTKKRMEKLCREIPDRAQIHNSAGLKKYAKSPERHKSAGENERKPRHRLRRKDFYPVCHFQKSEQRAFLQFVQPKKRHDSACFKQPNRNNKKHERSAHKQN